MRAGGRYAALHRGAGPGLRAAIVVSDWNGGITARLLAAAKRELVRAGANVRAVVRVPGSFELSGAAAAATRSGSYDLIVALGCVVRGETRHHEVVGDAAAAGLEAVAREGAPRVAVGFGVLTCETREQALERSAAGPRNAGATAARAALAMARIYRSPDLAGRGR